MIRSDRSNTSWMSWLIRKMPMPSCFSWATSSRTWSVSAGPRAAVGSSMIRTRALKWIARAMAIDCRWPPDRDFTGDLEVLEPRVEAAHDLAGRRLHRRVVEVADARRELAAEEHVRGGVDVVGQGQRLVDRLDAQRLGVARVADPDRLAVDEDLAGSAGWAPDSTRISVDLPAPLPPTRPTTSPGRRSTDDPVHGVDAAERDADVAHLDERAVDAGAGGPCRSRGA